MNALDPAADGFAAFALELAGQPTTAEAHGVVARAAALSLDGEAAIVLVGAKERARVAHSTHADAADATAAELDGFVGECVRSPTTRAPLGGFAGAVGVPLVARGLVFGALLVYSRTRALGEAETVRLRRLAAHAAAGLDQLREREGLALALDSRLVIGQAQGILMERFSLDADRAFAVLKRYSQDANVRLREIAERVVASRRLPDEP